jgi:hypothetical protein
MAGLSSCFPGVTSDSASAKRMLDIYDFCEPHDETKTYDTKVFQHDYGSGMRSYQYEAYEFSDKKTFIVAKSQVTPEEQHQLYPFCTCRRCRASWCTRFLYCAFCYGCVGSSFPSERSIKNSRVAFKANQDAKKTT